MVFKVFLLKKSVIFLEKKYLDPTLYLDPYQDPDTTETEIIVPHLNPEPNQQHIFKIFLANSKTCKNQE